jgi:anthranilate phosphoribosyltransferase
MARVLAAGGAIRALVVHGADGLDELSTTGPSTMYDWNAAVAPSGEVTPVTVDPAALGLAPARVADLLGGDAATNAKLARRVLAGEAGAHRDVVLLNAAAGLVAAGVSADLGDGLVRAGAAVDDGRAEAALERLIAVSGKESAQLGASH